MATPSWKKISNKLATIIDSDNRGVVLAVSGGVDSMLLLHFLNKQGLLAAPNIRVAHFWHVPGQIMDDRAADFITDVCRKAGIKLHLGMGDDTMLRKATSFEAEARKQRYRYFQSLLDYPSTSENAPGYIITAHNLSDQIEGILMNICRGVPVDRVAMARSTTFASSNITILRPFLDITKEQIVYYAKRSKVLWDEDETNANTKFERNLFRHGIIPILKSRRNIYKSIPKSVVTHDAITVVNGTLFDT